MKNTHLVYTTQEEKMLKDLKDIKNVKRQKNISLILSIFWLANTIHSIFRVPSLFPNIFLIIFILLMDLFFMAIFFTRFVSCKNLIAKHKCINDPKNNPLSELCKEKIDNCQKLIDDGESYYVVQKKYIELREFLDEYCDILPKETYATAKTELENIASGLIQCELKR